MKTTTPVRDRTPSLQAEQIKLARQGNPDAIAQLINKALHPKGIQALVQLKEDCLHIGLKSDRVLPQNELVPFVQKGLERLGMMTISTVAIYGLPSQSSTPAWRTGITLNQPSSRTASHRLLSRKPDKSEDGRNRTGAINAQIQAQTISGQVAIGHHILQIGHMSGGVVNFATSEPRPPKAIAPPIFLTPRPFPSLLDRQDVVKAIAAAFQAKQSAECYSTAGFGKTSVLRYVAHHPQLTASFPDGVVYLSAQRQPRTDLLQGIFEAFYETEPSFKPSEVQARRLLQSKQALILLDDVGLERDEVQSLLDALPSCCLLLTGESQRLWGDDGVAVLLPGLPIEDAIALVERTLQRSLSPSESRDVRLLCERLDGHPLRILQALAAMQQKRWAIADLLHQVPSAAAAEQLAVQAALSRPEPEQRVLSALAVLGDVPVGATPLAELAAVPDIATVLQSLSASHLIQATIRDNEVRYHLAENLTDSFQQLWHLEGWLDAAIQFFRSWAGQRVQAPQEIFQETDALMHLTEVALQQGRWADALNLGTLLDGPLTLSHRWGRWERSLQNVLEAAQASQNPAAEAWAMHQLGTQALCLEDAFTANLYLADALEVREGLGDTIGASITRHNLSLLVAAVPPAPDPDESAPPEDRTPAPPANPVGSGAWLSRLALFLLPILLGGAAVWYFWLRASALEFTPNGGNFSGIEVGTTAEAVPFQITNTGQRALEISQIQLKGKHPEDFAIESDTCSTTISIRPDETCTLTLRFQPTEAGTRTARLTIDYDDGKRSQQITVKGVGTAPDFGFEPNQLTFADQELGIESPAAAIAIRNTGTAPLRISEIAVMGEHREDFAILDDGCANTVAIAPDEDCTLTVQFTPSSTGEMAADLVITSNALGEAQRYTLRGTGVAFPRLSAEPSALNFQAQEVRTTSEAQTVTITSTGTDAVTVDQIRLEGNHADEFGLAAECAEQTLEPGQTCTISVRHQPTSTGTHTANLLIRSNAENELAPIVLRGEGTAAEVQVSTNGLTFGSQEVGTEGEWQSVQITNRGTAPLRMTDLELTGDGQDGFDWSDDCQDEAITIGKICTLRVRFTPSETGTHEATITLRSNAPNEAPQIRLSGTGTAAELAIAPQTVTFPAQEIQTRSASIPVQISNTGTAPLRIDAIASLSEFSLNGCTSGAIAPGDQCQLNVTFTPTATGQRSARVVLRSNAQNGEQPLTLQGRGTAARIEVSQSPVNFGLRRVETTSDPLSAQITNRGEAPLRLQAIALEGNHASDFAISGCANTTLAPDASCTLTVGFSPDGEGDRSATVVIPSNADNGTQRISLQGMGGLPRAEVSPLTIDFGDSYVVNQLGYQTSYRIVLTQAQAQLPLQAQTTVETITITSIGAFPLQIGDINLSGNTSDFRFNGCPPQTLDRGENCRITVEFLPTAEGERTAQLTIRSDAANAPLSVTLTGNGILDYDYPDPNRSPDSNNYPEPSNNYPEPSNNY
ncbi:MAG: choice-of-anchor D domain-containing protein [Synechococcales bacterium]|nr:choice-of-anchor D domain-containing protein [Synechococcales bacterium]